MSEQKPTVFLVDDDSSVLRALSLLLLAKDYRVQSYSSPEAFLAEYDASVPGCAIFDLVMPELNGLELQSRLTQAAMTRQVIFLSGKGDIQLSVSAMKAGAIDFLCKPVRGNELLSAISAAVEKDRRARQLECELVAIRGRLARLTQREYQVMTFVIAGRLNKQIANDLGIVEKTIKVHRGRMMKKLGVRTVAELVRIANKADIPLGCAARA